MNNQTHKKHRSQIAASMENDSILVMFAGEAPVKSEDESYRFSPNRNFYYLTGLDKPKMVLMISKYKGEVKETMFIEKGDPVMEKWIGKKMTQDEVREKTGIEDIQYIDGFNNQFRALLFKCEFETLYLDLNLRPTRIPSTEAQLFAQEVMKNTPFLKIKNIYYKLRELRVIKSEEEVENIRKAIEITKNGIENMMRHAKPDMNEGELEAHFRFTLRASGVIHHAFKPIVAGGGNAAVLHYEDNSSVIEDNSLVLIDLGATYGYYSADISRTFPINGKFTDRQKELYNIVLEAMNETIKAAKPGVPFRELNKVTQRVLAEGCKRVGLIKEDGELSKYYYHGVSHYLGLDTHDIGDYETKLAPGMVLTIEPGLYVEEEGIGIRIEDDILITEKGNKNLSKNILKTVEEIEAFMKQ